MKYELGDMMECIAQIGNPRKTIGKLYEVVKLPRNGWGNNKLGYKDDEGDYGYFSQPKGRWKRHKKVKKVDLKELFS